MVGADAESRVAAAVETAEDRGFSVAHKPIPGFWRVRISGFA